MNLLYNEIRVLELRHRAIVLGGHVRRGVKVIYVFAFIEPMAVVVQSNILG